MAKVADRPLDEDAPAGHADDAAAHRDPPGVLYVEDTVIGRWVISVFVVVLISAMVLSATPASRLTEVATPWRQPITDVTGLFQSWDLFAPNPRSTTERLEARLTYADGSERRWYPPAGGRFIGAYRGFRWRKWAGRVIDGDDSLRIPAARYIAAVNRRGGEFPIQVTLVELTYEAPGLGSGLRRDPDPEWDVNVFYILRVSADGNALEGRSTGQSPATPRTARSST